MSKFSKEESILSKLIDIYDAKKKESNPNSFLKVILFEINEIDKLIKENEKLVNSIVASAESYATKKDPEESTMLEKFGALNSGQQEILLDSLKTDSSDLLKILNDIRNILLEEKRTFHLDPERFKDLLATESQKIAELKKLMEDEGGITQKLANNLELVKDIKHSKIGKKIFDKISRFIVYPSFNVIVTGEENIPESGPVVIASRHYHGNFDPFVFNSISKRKLFFLGAIDWASDSLMKILPTVYRKMGIVPIKRAHPLLELMGSNSNKEPDEKQSDKKENDDGNTLPKIKEEIAKLLLLNQVVVIFPEGIHTVDLAGTRRDKTKIGQIYPGVFYFVDYVQKTSKKLIPIVPVGVTYSGRKWPRIVYEINIGKPLYLPLETQKINYVPYMDKLKKELERLSKLDQ